MDYESTLIDPDGEEYPYSESLDGDAYYYKISIVYGDRDGELQVMNEGVHIVFDDGEWMDFRVPPPERLFPDQRSLTSDDLLRLLRLLASDKVATESYSRSDMSEFYRKYRNNTDSQ